MGELSEILYEQALELQERHCGNNPLLDEGKLHSAVERPFATWDGHPRYRTIAECAAALLEGVTQNHPFADGNKRTAWLLMIFFLGAHGWTLEDIDPEEGERFVLDLVCHQITLQEATQWIAERLIHI